MLVTTQVAHGAALPLLLVLLSVVGLAQDPVAAVPAARPATSPTQIAVPHATDRVWLDQPGDGLVWARGNDWKASFGSAGVAFVPFLGSDAPRNYPLGLRLLSVATGEQPLPLELGAPATIARDRRVEIARGPVTEVYLLDPRHVEQQFVVASPVGVGPLTVRMAIVSELASSATADGGLTFANERGGVRYGAAVAIDARGNRCAVPSAVQGGELSLTVPAAFVAQATFPLLIDPVFSTFAVSLFSPTVTQHIAPDVAYVAPGGGIYATVVEEAYSATDHDVYVTAHTAGGAYITGEFIDYTTSYWSAPKIASHRGANQFLCVAVRTSLGTSTIWARTATVISTPAFSFGPQFAVQASGTGQHPDVGGDPNPSPSLPGNYCVTWTGNNSSLYYNIVRTNGTLLFPSGQVVPTGLANITNPSISKSSGVGAASTQQWVIVWQYTYGPNDEDIYATLIGSTGIVVVPVLPVSLSVASESNPQVSSMTDLTGGVPSWLVVYQRFVPGTILTFAHHDLYGSLFTGTQQQSFPVDLKTLLNRSQSADQNNPCVDTDGTRFAIGWSEKPLQVALDAVPYLATVHVVNGTTLAVTSYAESTNTSAGPDDHLQITSQRSGGSFTTSYMSVWDVENLTTNAIDSLGSLYGGYTNLPASSYFNHALPGCGAMTISASGLPALGTTFFLDLSGALGLPFLLLGTSVPPIPVCGGCSLGVDPATLLALYTTHFVLTVPQDTSLIGLQLASQGLDLLAPGGCAAPATFSLTDEIIVTIL